MKVPFLKSHMILGRGCRLHGGRQRDSSAADKAGILTGNFNFQHSNSAILSVNSVEAPVVMSSSEFDERLEPSLKRLRLSKRLLERVAGVSERRWWAPGTAFDDGAIEAGAKALAESGVEASDIGLLINTSVTRRNLEPSVAAKITTAWGFRPPP